MQTALWLLVGIGIIGGIVLIASLVIILKKPTPTFKLDGSSPETPKANP